MAAPAADEFRQSLHKMWSGVADQWAQYADDVDERGAPLTVQMLTWTAPRPGERVLELACGPGGTGLAAAVLVAPGGEVVLSDVAEEMVAVAATRARELELTNVHTIVLDLEQIEQPDASYDVVLCREGLMFATDPANAVGEIHRVLRPGGRAALAVWGPRERNPWLGLALDAVSDHFGMPVPPPGIPGPFSLSDASVVEAFLVAAGFSDVEVRDVDAPQHAESFDAWWRRTVALAGPVSTMLASQPEDAIQSIRSHAEESTRPYTSASGIDFPGVSLLATGRRG